MKYEVIKPIILTLGFELLELANGDEYLEQEIKKKISRCLSAIQQEYNMENEEIDLGPMGFLT
jgi:hypothetical protein